MNESVQYALAAGFEPGSLFPVFIAVVVIAAKIIQFVKRNSGRTPPAQPPPAQPIARASSAEDELRKFLKGLSTGQPSPRPEPPPPLQPQPAGRTKAFQTAVQGAGGSTARPQAAAVRAAMFETRVQGAGGTEPRPAVRHSPQPTTAPRPINRAVRAPAAPPPMPKAAPRARIRSAPAMAPAARPPAGGLQKRGPRAADMLKRLRGRESVQTAILLREILGQPIALRKPGTPSTGHGS